MANAVTAATIQTALTSSNGITLTGSYTASSSSSGLALGFWAVGPDGSYYIGHISGADLHNGHHSFSLTFNPPEGIPAGDYTIEAFATNSTSPRTLPHAVLLASQSGDPVCFMAGTRIGTPQGEVAVESLKPGDLVLTSEGEARPVRWLGRQTISTVFADPNRVLPIRVKAGALSEGVPSRDLLVSPDHALLVDNVLIHAGALVNGSSIVRENDVPEVFVYYHVELEDHALIVAENAAAETFIDHVDRQRFDNWDECPARDAQRSSEPLDYPRAKAARQVPERIRASLATRARAIAEAQAAVA